MTTIGASVRASVIVVGYNSLPDLLKGLPGALASLGSNDELLLVDNASTDGSVAAVRERFPEVQLIESTANLGFGGANNLGAERARGEFLVFLNPDTCVDPGWLEALLHPLQADESVGMVTSKIVLMSDPEIVNTCGNDVHLSGLTLCRGMGRLESEYTAIAEVGAVSGAAFAMRRDRFLELGGFDERFFLYMEDTDLSLRLRLTGQRILFAPESIVQHAYRLRFGVQKVYYQERNRYIMLLKLLRGRTLILMIPVWLFGELVSWGFVLLREPGQFVNKFKAYGWVLSHWKEIQASRGKVQNHRSLSDRQLLEAATAQLDYSQVESNRRLAPVFAGLNAISGFLKKASLKLI